jgi:hypothetical protein
MSEELWVPSSEISNSEEKLRAYVCREYFHFITVCNCTLPITVAARSKAWVCGRSITGIAGSNPARGHGCLPLVSVVRCQVEVSARGRSLIQGSPAECGVSDCDREASIMRRPRPTRGCCAIGKKIGTFSLIVAEYSRT